MILETKDLVEKRQADWLLMQAIIDEERKLKDGEELSAERNEEFKKLEKSIEKYDEQIDRIETTVKLKQEEKKRIIEKAEGEGKKEDETEEEEKRDLRVFLDYMAGGIQGVKAEDREVLMARAAQTTQTGSSGGFTIPTLLDSVIINALKAASGMRQVCNVVTSNTGAPINFPTNDDTSNNGRWLTENAAITNTAFVVAQKAMEAWTASSDSILMPIQLLQDNITNLDTWIPKMLGTRLGRLTNAAYTTGDGSSKPHGVTVDAHSSTTTASATVVVPAELITFQNTLDVAYEMNASWMFSQATRAAFRKLVDSNGQYMWQPGLRAGDPDLLLGKPYTLNNDVADIGSASNKFALYGDFKTYTIRDVMPLTLIRLEERYMDNLQIGFISVLRTDGRLLNANATTYNPMKVMLHAAS